MGQSNSEHSRHWFFGGNLIVDGVPQPKSLFKMVKETIEGERGHNLDDCVQGQLLRHSEDLSTRR